MPSPSTGWSAAPMRMQQNAGYERIAFEITQPAQSRDATQMRIAVGVASGTGHGTLPCDFNRQDRGSPGQQTSPGFQDTSLSEHVGSAVKRRPPRRFLPPPSSRILPKGQGFAILGVGQTSRNLLLRCAIANKLVDGCDQLGSAERQRQKGIRPKQIGDASLRLNGSFDADDDTYVTLQVVAYQMNEFVRCVAIEVRAANDKTQFPAILNHHLHESDGSGNDEDGIPFVFQRFSRPSPTVRVPVGEQNQSASPRQRLTGPRVRRPSVDNGNPCR